MNKPGKEYSCHKAVCGTQLQQYKLYLDDGDFYDDPTNDKNLYDGM